MEFKTSTIIFPKHPRIYILPRQRKIAGLCHKRGKIIVLHSCGNVDPVSVENYFAMLREGSTFRLA
jgi:hypothetical protein